jgi:polyisoprenoid-binding protein YceI
MNIWKRFKRMVLTVALLAATGMVLAEDADICAPFMDGKVDESLLEAMLSAANDGHLYRIQQSSSRVGFCVDTRLARIEGDFRHFQGGMALTAGDSTDGQTMVLIRADSLDTEGAIIKKMLKSEDFFDVEHYPEVLFISNGFKWTGPKTAVLKGDLTIRGITRPVTFNVTLTAVDANKVDKAQKILVKATTTIDRSEFGMKKLATMVNNNVQLCMSVEAVKYTA